ncbi:hypothetical protein TNIN_152241 [Trichonephila inaurata madagascariensis]|uniref:Uncharacterized protein n=1 Tax=Trichonephila inaurata madagascariensis TaxID=2747483 RepID=A0A8X6MFX3_9ARAC|nr:hypothetical protein TNIN_152241 [Trichonephila inaurata madagascariensis]
MDVQKIFQPSPCLTRRQMLSPHLDRDWSVSSLSHLVGTQFVQKAVGTKEHWQRPFAQIESNLEIIRRMESQLQKMGRMRWCTYARIECQSFGICIHNETRKNCLREYKE